MKAAYLGAVALIVTTAPAFADVKAGVDAWTRGEYAKAVAEWRGPAAAGDSDAQFNLGQAFKLGRGVPVDLPVATEWFRKAAVQGHALAQDNYGLALFQDGKKAEALPWLEKGAARDEKRTQLVLGTMLFNGDGAPKDWTRAYALVTRSSQQGLPQASQTLAQMDQYIPAAQRQEALTLARQIETQARALAVAQAPAAVPAARDASIPPGQAAAATAAVKTPPAKAAPAPKAPPRTAPAAPKPVAVATAASGSDKWRVQLGAFRDEGNAKALWTKVGARVGGQPTYTPAGGLTRLQAGPFRTRAEASKACASAKSAGAVCVVVGS